MSYTIFQSVEMNVSDNNDDGDKMITKYNYLARTYSIQWFESGRVRRILRTTHFWYWNPCDGFIFFIFGHYFFTAQFSIIDERDKHNFLFYCFHFQTINLSFFPYNCRLLKYCSLWMRVRICVLHNKRNQRKRANAIGGEKENGRTTT